MALLTGGIASAADAPDGIGDTGSTGVVQAAGEGAPAADVDAPDLQAAVSGDAAVALSLLNQFRAANGVAPVREEGALTVMAQAWATTLGAERRMATDPDLGSEAKPLPGYPVEGTDVPQYVVRGEGSPTVTEMMDYAKTNSAAVLLNPTVNHVGVGWSINGTDRVLYFISVEYDFTDIGPSDQFYDAVDFLYVTGITTGYPDGGFHPVGTVSREAMAAFLYRYVNETTAIPTCSADTARLFTDVTAGHPFCGAVEWLANERITTGYPDGTFHPGENVSREAMAAFLYRTFMADTIPACTSVRFSDVGTGHPFCGAIEWLAAEKVTTGWPDGTFRPGISVERQAMAAFLYRLAV